MHPGSDLGIKVIGDRSAYEVSQYPRTLIIWKIRGKMHLQKPAFKHRFIRLAIVVLNMKHVLPIAELDDLTITIGFGHKRMNEAWFDPKLIDGPLFGVFDLLFLFDCGHQIRKSKCDGFAPKRYPNTPPEFIDDDKGDTMTSVFYICFFFFREHGGLKMTDLD